MREQGQGAVGAAAGSWQVKRMICRVWVIVWGEPVTILWVARARTEGCTDVFKVGPNWVDRDRYTQVW